MSDVTDRAEPVVPVWAMDPVRRAIEFTVQELKLVDLTIKSITAVRSTVTLLESMNEQGTLSVNADDEAWTAARDVAEAAGAEVADNFRRLLGHSLVSMWGAVEAMADDLVVAFLVNEQGNLNRAEFANARIKFSDFAQLGSDEERMEALLAQVATGLPRNGMDRFENRLELVMLSGSYNAKMADAVYELQHMRNALVHRAGVVDRRLVRACPHLGLRLGEPIPLSQTMQSRYGGALVLYIDTVANRIRERFGVSPVPKNVPAEFAP